jgi:hypothetical protein
VQQVMIERYFLTIQLFIFIIGFIYGSADMKFLEFMDLILCSKTHLEGVESLRLIQVMTIRDVK